MENFFTKKEQQCQGEQWSDRIATLAEKATPKRQLSQFQHVDIKFRALKGRVYNATSN